MKLQRRRLRCILAYAHVFLEIKNYTLNTKTVFLLFTDLVTFIMYLKMKIERRECCELHVSCFHL